MAVPVRLRKLVDWIAAHPTILTNDTPSRGMGSEVLGDGSWWVKFAIDTAHPHAWSSVQVFGHTLNYLTLNERLGTVFMPVSPPPYLNGGPDEFLSWVIEGGAETEPDSVADRLDEEFNWLPWWPE